MARRALALALAALLSCGQTTPTPPAPEPPLAPVSADQYSSQAAAAFCAHADRCFGKLFTGYLRGEDCLVHATRHMQDGETGAILRLVEAGALAFDPDRAAACVHALAGLPCDPGVRKVPACDGLAIGAAAAGDSCTVNEECGPSSYCRSANACPGACAPRRLALAACTPGEVCERGYSCSQRTGVCEPDLPEGARCTGEMPCAGGLRCFAPMGKPLQDAGRCTARILQPTQRVGDRCDITKDDGPFCEPTASCELVGEVLDGDSTFVCVVEKPAGGPCGAASPDACPPDEYCPIVPNAYPPVMHATCRKHPAVGEPCVTGVQFAQCGPAARCVKGICTAMQRLGGPCEAGWPICYSDRCVGNTCVAPLDCLPP